MTSTATCNPGDKTYLLAHQNVSITTIDFKNKRLVGFTELLFVPLKLNQVSKVKLNTKQCQIIKILAKGSAEYHSCDFTYNDPLLEILQTDVQPGFELQQPERSIKKFGSRHHEAVLNTELDFNASEINLTLPAQVQKEISDGSTFKIFVEYIIEQPQGGLHFVTPDEDDDNKPIKVGGNNPFTGQNTNASSVDSARPTNATSESTAVNPPSNTNGFSPKNSPASKDGSETDAQKQERQQVSTPDGLQETGEKLIFAHLFTYKNHNNSRLWCPCLDSYNQPCTWLLEFTVESHLTVVSCGDLIGTYSSQDKRYKTFRYELNIPTSAPNIGFAVGQFGVWTNPSSLVSTFPIKTYFLNGLEKLAEASCGFLNESAEFYEELLTFKYPYSNYKQVFVDQAYEPFQSYATMSICCTNLLHSKHIIDQTFITRTVLSDALAAQYFSCFISMSSWSAAWLTRGISLYMAAQYRRKVFGNNEYRFKVRETMKELINYEQKFGGIVLDESSMVQNKSKTSFHFSTQSPHTTSPFYDQAHKLKSFLVIRMLEDKIGKMLLIQVFNKILSLASTASQQPASMNMWGNLLISTANFEKSVFTVTGKDKEIASFLEHWIYQAGHAKFNASFAFDRKRNVVELNIKQSETQSLGIRPYFGSITVTVQELDGTFPQKLNIEENKTTPFTIICRSKSRRNKKKKIPLCTGEEVDMDLSMMDNHDSPVLWIRIDPDMQILRQILFEQPDYNWQYQLKYERDITAQLDSLDVLIDFPTAATRKTLMEVIEDERCFYRVRCTASLNLTKIANDMAITTTSGGWQAPTSMINIYKKLFGSHTCPHIIRLNDFSPTNLQSYFLQKTIPKALAGLRVPPHRICPPEVLKFLLDLFKYNDNSKNSFADNYYRASLIEALAETVTPVVVPLFNNSAPSTTLDQLPSETKLVAEEIIRCLNLEKILPCYRYVVTVACLKAIQQLQRMGHLPSNSNLFRSYTLYNLFFDVRCAAVVQIVDIIRAEQGHEDLNFLLDLVENDPVPAFKFFILAQIQHNPPVSIQTFPNYIQIRERLWTMMNSRFAHDSKLRCATADVFHRLFGKSDKSGGSSNLIGDGHKSKKKKKKKDKDRDKEKKKSKKLKENFSIV